MLTSIADASFLLDWARYSKRDLIFRVFNLIWLPESVLAEIKSEPTISWLANNLAADRMAIYPEIRDVRDEALRIIELSRAYPARTLDYPEAVCLAIGKAEGFIVLSENGGAYAAQFIYLKEVKVWRAFEVLLELLRGEFIEKSEFHRYQEETFHIFSRKDLERIGL